MLPECWFMRQLRQSISVGSEIVVRVNGQDTPFYDEDVKAMVKARR